MRKQIKELEEYKAELHESLDTLYNAKVPAEWLELRKQELLSQIHNIEECIEELKDYQKTYKVINTTMAITIAIGGLLLLWVYLVSDNK